MRGLPCLVVLRHPESGGQWMQVSFSTGPQTEIVPFYRSGFTIIFNKMGPLPHDTANIRMT